MPMDNSYILLYPVNKKKIPSGPAWVPPCFFGVQLLVIKPPPRQKLNKKHVLIRVSKTSIVGLLAQTKVNRQGLIRDHLWFIRF
jgi:hypothetical protein